MNLEHIIASAAELGATKAMVALGVTSGEVSSRQAEQTYGKWFKEAVANKRLRPVRVGNGKTGTKWYRVTDILTLRTLDEARAELIINN